MFGHRAIRSGMTLMEVLTCIVIILVLMSILMPTIDKHKEAAKLVICSSNLHQMHIAYRSWRADHPESFGKQRGLPRNWTGELTQYLGEYSEVLTCPSDHALSKNGGGSGSDQSGSGDVDFEDIDNMLTPPQGAGNILIEKKVPRNLRLGKVQNTSAVRVYKERSRYKLKGDLRVNMTKTGIRGGGQGKPSHGEVEEGTEVDVYLLHYDPAKGKKIVRNARLTFGGEVLGIITQIPTLNQTDRILGHAGTKYYTGRYRGIEFSDDIITFEKDRMSVTVNYFRTPGWMEEMRVVVTPSEYTSYGMNVDERPNGIMFSDYYKPLFDILNENDDPYLQAYMDDPSTFPGRHFGQINVLFYGGNVKLMKPVDFFDDTGSHWGADETP